MSLAATIAAGLGGLGLGAAGVAAVARQRQWHRWVPQSYGAGAGAPVRERIPADAPQRIYIAVCDHYEPEWNRPPRKESIARVDRWVAEYPERFARFADSVGRPPQHSFFFPQDEYRPEYLDRLAKLCDRGFGECEIHLHHRHDTEAGFEDKLSQLRDALFHEHGQLRIDPATGEVAYGFIHGNWALNNSRPDGDWCGVDHETPILRRTGCYADFTMPSAPSNTQTRQVNSIYWATDGPGRKSHDVGPPAEVGVEPPPESLLMVQGPLRLDWGDRRAGIIPRTENGDLHAGRPPAIRRLGLWRAAHVHVVGKPEWTFVKLHTHGCKDGNIDVLLGEPMERFHAGLADFAVANPQIEIRYVTAWEMALAIREAVAGEAQAATEAEEPTFAGATS